MQTYDSDSRSAGSRNILNELSNSMDGVYMDRPARRQTVSRNSHLGKSRKSHDSSMKKSKSSQTFKVLGSQRPSKLHSSSRELEPLVMDNAKDLVEHFSKVIDKSRRYENKPKQRSIFNRYAVASIKK